MSEQNKRIFAHLMEEVFNQGNFDVADALVAPDVRNHEMSATAPVAAMLSPGLHAGCAPRFPICRPCSTRSWPRATSSWAA